MSPAVLYLAFRDVVSKVGMQGRSVQAITSCLFSVLLWQRMNQHSCALWSWILKQKKYFSCLCNNGHMKPADGNICACSMFGGQLASLLAVALDCSYLMAVHGDHWSESTGIGKWVVSACLLYRCSVQFSGDKKKMGTLSTKSGKYYLWWYKKFVFTKAVTEQVDWKHDVTHFCVLLLNNWPRRLTFLQLVEECYQNKNLKSTKTFIYSLGLISSIQIFFVWWQLAWCERRKHSQVSQLA